MAAGRVPGTAGSGGSRGGHGFDARAAHPAPVYDYLRNTHETLERAAGTLDFT